MTRRRSAPSPKHPWSTLIACAGVGALLFWPDPWQGVAVLVGARIVRVMEVEW